MKGKTGYVHFATGTPVPPDRMNTIEAVTVERYMELRSRSLAVRSSTAAVRRGSVNGKLK